MTHARQQIRHRVTSLTLLTMAEQTGAGEVYRSRTRPITLYPSIAVTGDNEYRLDVENPGYINADPSDKRYRRFYDLKIEVAVQTESDPDNVLDALCSQVETLMAADDNMGGGVIATDLISCIFERSGAGEKQTHICVMTYRCEFRTTAADPETFLA